MPITITVTCPKGIPFEVYLPDDVRSFPSLLLIISTSLQCKVSLLKAEIYRLSSIPPGQQRITFQVRSFATVIIFAFFTVHNIVTIRRQCCTRMMSRCQR